METPRLIIKQNNTYPDLVATIKDANGAVIDLTNVTNITFTMRNAETGVVKVDNQTATITSPATAGKAKYIWQDGDTDTPGEYIGTFNLGWPTGKEQSAPQSGNILVSIMPAGIS